ncbi:MAG: hypothetical protein QM786_02140 [Breznakibacter sp.]
MKTCFSIAILLLGFPVWLGNVYGQSAPLQPAAKPSSKELALTRAEIKQAKIERKIETADSLISANIPILEEIDRVIISNNDERKVLDKQYSQKRKALEKKVASKDKKNAADAKVEIKTLDTEYKTAAKASDADLRLQLKKLDKTNKALVKADMGRKSSLKMLKEAQKSVRAAQKALSVPEKKGKRR